MRLTKLYGFYGYSYYGKGYDYYATTFTDVPASVCSSAGGALLDEHTCPRDAGSNCGRCCTVRIGFDAPAPKAVGAPRRRARRVRRLVPRQRATNGSYYYYSTAAPLHGVDLPSLTPPFTLNPGGN